MDQKAIQEIAKEITKLIASKGLSYAEACDVLHVTQSLVMELKLSCQ